MFMSLVSTVQIQICCCWLVACMHHLPECYLVYAINGTLSSETHQTSKKFISHMVLFLSYLVVNFEICLDCAYNRKFS